MVISLNACLFSALSAQTLTDLEEAKIQEELKALKKNLIKLKALKEENRMWDQKIDQSSRRIDSLKDAFDRVADEEERQIEVISLLQSVYFESLKRTRNIREGVFFRVQIAYYQKHPLDRFYNVGRGFYIEREPNGRKRYMLGFFRSYYEAKALSQWLNYAGSGSYVVGYRRGKRVRQLSSIVD